MNNSRTILIRLFKPLRLATQKCFFSLLFLIVGFSGCTKKPREAQVQVFIVTKAGENIKLGLIEVRALSAEAVKLALAPALSRREANLANIDAQIATAKKQHSEQLEAHQSNLLAAKNRKVVAAETATKAIGAFQAAIDAASAAAETYSASVRKKLQVDILDPNFSNVDARLRDFEDKLGGSTLRGMSIYLGEKWDDYMSETIRRNLGRAVDVVNREQWKGLPDHRATVLKLATELKNALDTADKSVDDLRRFAPSPSDDSVLELESKRRDAEAPDLLLSVLPVAPISAKTDADGKCQLFLPRNQHWMLAASGVRRVVDRNEYYYWIVPVPENNDPTVSLFLSNDNLLEAGQSPKGL